MTATVANTALVGEAARLARAYGASTRAPIDGAHGTNAAPGREWSPRFDGGDDRSDPGTRRRRAEFQDQVISFGGVLVSLEVGAAIVGEQATNGLRPTPAADAERQVANYERAQAIVGPAEPMMVMPPLQSMAVEQHAIQ